MIGLVAKDFIVFKKICKPAYRLLGIILLLCACIFIPQAAIPYISLLLPLMGVAFLTELVKIEEKSDWKNTYRFSLSRIRRLLSGATCSAEYCLLVSLC